MKRVTATVATALTLLGAAVGVTLYLGLREDDSTAVSDARPAEAELVARGAYLARAGDCMACHTARGGASYAGGRAILTPFGAIASPNITPDNATGIGRWSADDFWRALHNGKGRDGKLLYPAFPYPDYTRITRADADAMYAYLRTLPPVRQQNRAPALRFPFNFRALLIGWRALYFRPGVYRSQPAQNAEWNRGAYLVQGLGHCSACHAPRNFLGATESGTSLNGALIPMLNWYASPLTGGAEAGLGKWRVQDVTDLLRTGVSARGAVAGPMAEVVRQSLQHLSAQDARAMAVYLKSLPQPDAMTTAAEAVLLDEDDRQVLARGAALYDKHCAECHDKSGSGAPPAYPPLAGNRVLVLKSAVNPIRAVLHGGYPPSTAGNPRPYGMPPFANVLTDEEIAAVLSYVRNAWDNHAPMVQPAQVNRYRVVPLD
jgi:mono/diheme cytochrome c family protein